MTPPAPPPVKPVPLPVPRAGRRAEDRPAPMYAVKPGTEDV